MPDHLEPEMSTVSPVLTEPESDPTDAEVARAELFALNGIDDVAVAQWKSQYGDVGWTSFLIPGVPYAVVFVYRVLTRGEWKKTIRPRLATPGLAQDEANEYVASYATLHPLMAKDPSYWEDKPGLIPDTLATIVLNASGGDPLIPPMRL